MLTVFGSTFLSITTIAPRLVMGADLVTAEEFTLHPGGRGATQALAAHLSGAKVRFASAIGHDAFGDLTLGILRDKGLDLSGIQRIPLQTGMCVTVKDMDSQVQRIISRGASGAMTIDDIPENWLDRWTTLLVQGEVNETTNSQAINKVFEQEGRSILHLSPLAPVSEALLDKVDYLVLNEIEATELAASFAMRTSDPRSIAFDIAARRNGPVLIITQQLDLYIGFGANVEHIPRLEIKVVDRLGADDALVGVFAAGISQGLPLVDVVHRAVAAAGLTASKYGLQDALPAAEDIEAVVNDWPQHSEERATLRRKPAV